MNMLELTDEQAIHDALIRAEVIGVTPIFVNGLLKRVELMMHSRINSNELYVSFDGSGYHLSVFAEEEATEAPAPPESADV